MELCRIATAPAEYGAEHHLAVGAGQKVARLQRDAGIAHLAHSIHKAIHGIFDVAFAYVLNASVTEQFPVGESLELPPVFAIGRESQVFAIGNYVCNSADPPIGKSNPAEGIAQRRRMTDDYGGHTTKPHHAHIAVFARDARQGVVGVLTQA